ncbi:hypothetical protein [Tsukamurella sp. 1534]|uniref:hypothetical protein n=1 Tax=Tsukamurella sp. 1534 TaxID=1151061 RepID=UPI0002EE1499|nr:hypothetical protein [Tsukamurella sp. 1534]
MTTGNTTLASALQRAFAEAGDPSVTEVADSGVGVSRQRISDWRAGRHVPSRFGDLEPVITYLQISAARRDEVSASTSDRVTAWPKDRWREVWREAVGAPEEPEPPTPGTAEAEASMPAHVDRRPIALAVVALLVVLVAALAVAAYLLSAATM